MEDWGWSLKLKKLYSGKRGFTFFGYKDGCSYCGKPLTVNYSFCPFTTPQIVACDRKLCKLRRSIRNRTIPVKFMMIDFLQWLKVELESSL